MTADEIRAMARVCGFELAGVAAAEPSGDRARYHEWVAAGYAGEMRYLTDRRAQVRDDPRNLLASARSAICVGKLYNTPLPYSTEIDVGALAWISRYAWGGDYHDTVRRGLERLDAMLRERAAGAYESKLCVDTAPLLERSYARAAGLGWIGKNTCLINQGGGSWFFLGEILTSLEIAPDAPPPDRCGSCTRCIDACPTAAIDAAGYTLDARRCISYFTIELREAIPEEWRASVGGHVFGCDICQDVCPWNSLPRKAPIARDPELAPRPELVNPLLEWLAQMDQSEFEAQFNGSPVRRAGFDGLRRNVAIAIGNSGLQHFVPALKNWSDAAEEGLRTAAHWALSRLNPRA